MKKRQRINCKTKVVEEVGGEVKVTVPSHHQSSSFGENARTRTRTSVSTNARLRSAMTQQDCTDQPLKQGENIRTITAIVLSLYNLDSLIKQYLHCCTLG